MSKYLFVYGTLKKGEGNHRLLKDCEYVCDAELWDHRMYSLGGFPGIVPDDYHEGNPAIILGEIYLVDKEDTWDRLDGLEGYDKEKDRGMYLRREVRVYPRDNSGDELVHYNKEMVVQVYVWNGRINEKDRIKTGVW
jgi:gamma-glutamylcyclotransferase (GGCT)/AIG2-like uncharacterized protein YtfP